VRTVFREWVASQMPPGVVSQHEDLPLSPLQHQNPRFTYCIHVDSALLESLNSRAPPYECPSVHGECAFVNLVTGDDMHELDTQTRRHQARCPWDHPDYGDTLDGEDTDPWDEGEEEVEGCKLYDVGWAKVGVASLYPEVYAMLIDDNRWHTHYCRPPGIMHC